MSYLHTPIIPKRTLIKFLSISVEEMLPVWDGHSERKILKEVIISIELRDMNSRLAERDKWTFWRCDYLNEGSE